MGSAFDRPQASSRVQSYKLPACKRCLRRRSAGATPECRSFVGAEHLGFFFCTHPTGEHAWTPSTVCAPYVQRSTPASGVMGTWCVVCLHLWQWLPVMGLRPCVVVMLRTTGMSADPRDTQAYRNARAALRRKTKKRGWNCWLCGKPFDWTLHPSDANAWTADHVTPLAKGGSVIGTLKPAHRRCNSRRNKGDHEERVPTTRQW